MVHSTKQQWVDQFESRLISFAVGVLKVTDQPTVKTSEVYLYKQLARSCTSPALNYGEACSAESQKDFIHKLKICLKEMNESRICLIILHHTLQKEELKKLISEASELAKILSASIKASNQKARSKQARSTSK